MLKKFILAISFIFLSNIAHSESQYGKFKHFSELPSTAFLIGKITQGDSFDFRKLLRNHEIKTLVISSPGGSVWEALSIAGIVHDNDTNVYIPRNAECYSACSFIFFAGKSRIANGKLGVHQFSSVDANAKENVGVVEGGTQFTTSEIIGFLNDFGTPAWVYEKMFAQKEMYVFSKDELSTFQRGIMAGFQATNVEQFIVEANISLTRKLSTKPKVKPEPKWTYKTETLYLDPVSSEWVYDDTGYKNTFRILAENNHSYEFRVFPEFVYKPRVCERYSKNIVLQVQNKLRRKGYDVGTPDGLMGQKTARGIRAFQRSAAMKISGKIDRKLLNKLDIDEESEYLVGPSTRPQTFPIPPNMSLFIDIPYFYAYVQNRRFCYYLKVTHMKKVPAN